MYTIHRRPGGRLTCSVATSGVTPVLPTTQSVIPGDHVSSKMSVSNLCFAISAIVSAATAFAAPAADSGALDTIVVTAQRRSENLQDVPLSVSSFSAQSLEAQQVISTLDITRVVPNMVAMNNVGQASANVYYIRGLGQTQSFPTFEPQVGTYVDDIYIGRQNANNLSLFGVDQVQVLRGPQGTLFGRNSTGGAIVVNLTKPADKSGGDIEAGYGNYGRKSLRISVDTPMSDTLKTRLSMFTVEDDGYVRNLTTHQTLNKTKNYGIRESITYRPSNAVEWNVSGDYIDNDAANVLNFPSASGSSRVSYSGFSTQGGALTGPLFGIPGYPALLTGKKATLGQGAEVITWSLTSNLKVAYESGTLNFITGYRGLHQLMAVDFPFAGFGPLEPFDQSPIGQFALAQDLNSHQFSQEIKWTGEVGRLKYSTGLFYLNEKSHNDFGAAGNFGALGFLFGLPTLPSLPATLGDETAINETTSTAAYFQGDYVLAKDWTLTFGGRYTHEQKKLSARGNTPGGFSTADIQAEGFLTDLSVNEFTPRLALNYKVDSNLMFYASATRGFQGGGWNGLAFKAADYNNFNPETVWSYEGGMRSESSDHKLRLNVNVFQENVSAYQLLSDNGSSFVTRNAADFEAHGVEAELAWRATEGLTLEASLGLMDAKYKNPSAAVAEQQAGCQAGNAALCLNGIVDAAGHLATPSNTPHSTGSLHAMYDWTAGHYTITANAAMQYVGNQNVGTEGSPNGFDPSYTTYDLGVTAKDNDSGLSVSAECRNCGGKNWGTAYLFGYKYWNVPGTYGLRINYKW